MQNNKALEGARAAAELDVLLDEKLAANYLGFAVSTLQKRRVAGLEPRFVKLSRLVRYRKSDLDEWITRSVVNSTSECA